MSRRSGRTNRDRTARAYVDGRLFSTSGWGGVRITVRVGQERPVSRFLESTGQDALEAHLLGIEEALLMAREMGARTVSAFCESEDAVALTAETADVPASLLAVHLRIRALTNQFKRAAVVPAGVPTGPPGPSALRDFGGAEVRLLGQPRNLSLFPALQG
jgi:hypothetical protein